MKYTSHRSKRNRNLPKQEKNKKPFFSAKSDAVQTKADNPFFQAKLTIGQPGDKYEKEADSMADAVVNNSGNNNAVVQQKEADNIQRVPLSTPMEDEKLSTAEQRMERDKYIQEKPEEGIQKMEKEESIQKMEEEEPIQQKEEEEAPVQMQTEEEGGAIQTKSNGKTSTANPKLSNQLQNTSEKGQKMPKNTRAEMETAFGHDFSGVNIHTNEAAVSMNKNLGAQAFTHGKDVYFNAGKFQPETSKGKHLLVHELTHVVQQGGGKIKKQIQKSNGGSTKKKRDVVSEEMDPIGSQKHDKKDSATQVPGLTQDIHDKVAELIGKKKRREALNILVEYLKKDGQIDGSLLKGGKIRYGGAGEGSANPPGYKKDPATGEKRARPTPVKLGRASFKNVSWLYSSLMHEYMHVLQFQEPAARGTKGQRSLKWLMNRQEVEAYAYEIMNAKKTGLINHPKLVRVNWNRLNSYWRTLGKSSKKLLATMYENVYQAAKKIVKGKKLTYRPYKGK